MKIIWSWETDDLNYSARWTQTGAFYVGLLDGLLGVAGMIMNTVSQWIIPVKIPYVLRLSSIGSKARRNRFAGHIAPAQEERKMGWDSAVYHMSIVV